MLIIGQDFHHISLPILKFINEASLTIVSKAPVDYALKMLERLGLAYLTVVQETLPQSWGVVKRLLKILDELRDT